MEDVLTYVFVFILVRLTIYSSRMAISLSVGFRGGSSFPTPGCNQTDL